MDDLRPDPDRLLAALQADEQRAARGKLTIFFGACAGVGKTFAMLQALRQQREAGCEGLVGIVETHGRQETARLLEGLPMLPSRRVAYRGHDLAEFDLDAVLALHPPLIVVDELAHSNVEGSRHRKRWQDVAELLAAGIDVYTALNVQHLESLNDIVAGITGIPVRETVPDRVFDEADEVRLVDLPPDELLSRLAAGKVYLPDAAERARQHFFRKGNLIALRELALRRTADRVDAQMRAYRADRDIQPVWEARDRLLVCVGGEGGDRLVREAARLAARLQTDWIAVHVDAPRGGRRVREEALQALKLAAGLGAEITTLSGGQVEEVLAAYARSRNATKLLCGVRPQSGRRWRWQRALPERIVARHPDLDVILVSSGEAARTAPRIWHPVRPVWRDYGWATLACAATTALSALLLQVFAPANVIMLLLLTVVLVAIRWGRGPGAWAAFLAVGCFDFFFVPPFWSFTVNDTQYLFTFFLMLGVALLIGQLAASMRNAAHVARLREFRAKALARLARELSGALQTEQIVSIATEQLEPLLTVQMAMLLPDAHETLKAVGALPVDREVAQWVYDNQQEAGAGTQTLAATDIRYVPLKAPMRTRGVLALQLTDSRMPDEPEWRHLLDGCCAQIALALERVHYVEVAQDALVSMEGERMRNTLLSAVSHDLRTPITAIAGLAGTLEKKLADPAQQELAHAIHSEATQMNRLVSNLLDMARLQSGGVKLRLDWQSLEEVVGSALGQLRPVLARHPVQVSLPAELPLLEFDALLIERVLVNLLDNAAKYTPAGSGIRISARLDNGWLRLRVDDEGPGLPEPAESLFQPFVRGVRESATSGAGLGLALCRLIVEAHGGTIATENRQEGGTRFVVALPVKTAVPEEIE